MPLDVFSTLMKQADNLAVDVMWQVCFWSTQVRGLVGLERRLLGHPTSAGALTAQY